MDQRAFRERIEELVRATLSMVRCRDATPVAARVLRGHVAGILVQLQTKRASKIVRMARTADKLPSGCALVKLSCNSGLPGKLIRRKMVNQKVQANLQALEDAHVSCRSLPCTGHGLKGFRCACIGKLGQHFHGVPGAHIYSAARAGGAHLSDVTNPALQIRTP